MSKQHVLIVDEDLAEAETLAQVLRTEGYGTDVVDSGREAVDALRGHGPDLLLTDVGMPGAEGARLFAEVREAWPWLPVLVLAAEGAVGAAVDAVRWGAADFAVKPVHPGELLHRCARVFRERAVRDENAELKERLGNGEEGGDGAAPGRDEAGEDRLVERLMASEITFEDFEREILVRALGRTRGNQSRAARLLGMTRRTLQYRIEKFDIDTASMRA